MMAKLQERWYFLLVLLDAAGIACVTGRAPTRYRNTAEQDLCPSAHRLYSSRHIPRRRCYGDRLCGYVRSSHVLRQRELDLLKARQLLR